MQEKEKLKPLQFFCFDEKQPDMKKRILVARIIKNIQIGDSRYRKIPGFPVNKIQI